MEGKRFLRSLSLRNLLSFGSEAEPIELRPLNVLIGPNGSGKSNLIEAISLLRAAPTDLRTPIREGGGITEWLWKGPGAGSVAQLDATIHYPSGTVPLRYRLALVAQGQSALIEDEAVENADPLPHGDSAVEFFYRLLEKPTFMPRIPADSQPGTAAGRTEESPKAISIEHSVLSQRKDPVRYPEITFLGDSFKGIRLYREWGLGRRAACRLPQRADLPEDFLLEDGANLGLVLNDLEHRGTPWVQLLSRLREFCDGVLDLTVKIQGGTVQVFLHERGLSQPVPATRLSDGTLRYLCLLAILCHPEPPPLVCIEEPELGLHPDIMPDIADLLIEASSRTQLIVTTHSDVLVSALSDVPEAVLVCERGENGTRMERLDPDSLQEWLKKYQLGELWRMGEIGGNR